MKKHFITSLLFLGLAIFSIKTSAQSMDVMKKQIEVLKTTADLLDKKIDLAKEQENNEKLGGTVDGLNKRSNNKTDDFSSSDPRTTAKDAKNTAKVLKKTESANKDLERSNDKIIDLQADIKKIEMKLNKMKYAVEIKEN